MDKEPLAEEHFKVIRLRLTKKTIKKFYFPVDGRSIIDSKEKFEHDLYYLKNRSLEKKNP